jgi:hypothetical protein
MLVIINFDFHLRPNRQVEMVEGESKKCRTAVTMNSEETADSLGVVEVGLWKSK